MTPPQAPLDREKAFHLCFFGLFAFFIYQLFLLATPFLPALLGAFLLALAFYPLHERLRALRMAPSATALASTAAALLAVVLPFAGVAWLALRESGRLVPAAAAFLDGLRTLDLDSLRAALPGALAAPIDAGLDFLQALHIDLNQVILDNAAALGQAIASWGAFAARNALLTLFNGLILSIALFFAFRDGERAASRALELVPMRSRHKETLTRRVHDTLIAVLLGVLATAVLQGLTAMIGYRLAGLRIPALLGLATGMASLLGTTMIVTVPVALSVLREDAGRGFFLIAWSALVVGMLDHFVKVLVIGARARLPLVLIFISVLGGLKTYGFLGFLLGPMLVACFLTIAAIYREDFRP